MTTAGRHPQWRTSSYSGGNGGNCVESAIVEDRALVRDSKLVDGGPVHSFTRQAWTSLTKALRSAAR
ncbi:DUF397 domain-containing protein [Streptomyces sp. SID3343]|uniref:DUF397 domain-containing protein n=1 Tax=Streptomyces sp. SID3343 TaxID=2690260 RepID=UPI00136A6F00|nr:DUF397 domain-containing protein [Streptomyces sp. SID3343]MYV99700.1 DUF397 domain-containing protein [Streptomyces sp. SID3343]